MEDSTSGPRAVESHCGWRPGLCNLLDGLRNCAGSSDNPENLKRALVCVDRQSGAILWTKSVESVLPEDEFRGMFAENGYASHTPACDGEHIYCFFGKTGVVAFDLEGNQLWQTSVGTGLDPRGWGSASSPILYENLVIVTASAESESLVALDKATGKEVWREEAPTLVGTWTTPVLVALDGDRTDLVISVPSELWGLNPRTGKLRWYCIQPGGESNSATASVVVSEGPEPVAYVLGGRDNGSMAAKVGGKGDVTQANTVWQGSDRASIGTPLLHAGRPLLDFARHRQLHQRRDGRRDLQGATPWRRWQWRRSRRRLLVAHTRRRQDLLRDPQRHRPRPESGRRVRATGCQPVRVGAGGIQRDPRSEQRATIHPLHQHAVLRE